jgi:Ribonuclease G/E
MARRGLYLDEGPGETRAVVTLDDAPERLLIQRADDVYPRLGERYVARVARIDRGIGLALLDLGEAGAAALRLKPDRAAPHEGAALEVEIAIEPQGRKAAVARLVGEASGAPRRVVDAPDVRQWLLAWAPGAEIQSGAGARAMADEAVDQALAIEFDLIGSGSIAIETTRALTSIDVDLGAGGGRDAKRAARQANLAAIAEAARLLRLKAIAGLVVIDLVGQGHDGQALSRMAQTAFAPDQPGLVIGPVTRFGTLDLAVPRRHRPIKDILCGAGQTPSALTRGLALLRAIEREARALPGGRLDARAAPETAAAAQTHAEHLRGRIGARFQIVADPALAVGDFHIGSS